jgi:ribosomal protein L40E
MPEERKEAPPEPPGIRCRKCGCADLRTRHTRRHRDKIRRERECRNCGKTMWTTEKEG